MFDIPGNHRDCSGPFDEKIKKIVYEKDGWKFFTRRLMFGHGYYVETSDPELMKKFNRKAKPIYNKRIQQKIECDVKEDKSDLTMEEKLANARKYYQSYTAQHCNGWNIIEECIEVVCCHGGLTYYFWREDLLCVGFDTCMRFRPLGKEQVEKYMEGKDKVTDDVYIANCHLLKDHLLRFINGNKRKRSEETQQDELDTKKQKKNDLSIIKCIKI